MMIELTWPNRISLMRLLLIAPFVLAMLHLQDPQRQELARWAAIIIYLLMAISDGLDGYLARRWNQVTEAGKFIDPVADKLLVLCSVVLLANEGTHVSGMLLPDWVAVIAISKDILVVVGFCIVYFTTNQIFIRPTLTGKSCTTIQLVMVIAILLSPDLPDGLTWLPPALWWLASLLAIATLIDYFQNGRRFLAKHESPAAE